MPGQRSITATLRKRLLKEALRHHTMATKAVEEQRIDQDLIVHLRFLGLILSRVVNGGHQRKN